MGGINSGPHRSTRLRLAAAKRFDVSQLQRKAVAEQWPEGTVHRLSFEPYPGRLITARVELTFILPGAGGRRYYWLCSECGRKARFLYGGRPDPTKPNRIACSACQRLLWPSQHQGRPARLRVQLAKIEARLGGKPANLTPPRGSAKRTFARLAAFHAYYTACLTRTWELHPKPVRKGPVAAATQPDNPDRHHGGGSSLGAADWLV